MPLLNPPMVYSTSLISIRSSLNVRRLVISDLSKIRRSFSYPGEAGVIVV